MRLSKYAYAIHLGPYWYPASELLRQNVVEDQAGVPLELEIGLIDVHTCEPLPDAMISIWVSMPNGTDPAKADNLIALQRHWFLQQLRV